MVSGRRNATASAVGVEEGHPNSGVSEVKKNLTRLDMFLATAVSKVRVIERVRKELIQKSKK